MKRPADPRVRIIIHTLAGGLVSVYRNVKTGEESQTLLARLVQQYPSTEYTITVDQKNAR